MRYLYILGRNCAHVTCWCAVRERAQGTPNTTEQRTHTPGHENRHTLGHWVAVRWVARAVHPVRLGTTGHHWVQLGTTARDATLGPGHCWTLEAGHLVAARSTAHHGAPLCTSGHLHAATGHRRGTPGATQGHRRGSAGTTRRWSTPDTGWCLAGARHQAPGTGRQAPGTMHPLGNARVSLSSRCLVGRKATNERTLTMLAQLHIDRRNGVRTGFLWSLPLRPQLRGNRRTGLFGANEVALRCALITAHHALRREHTAAGWNVTFFVLVPRSNLIFCSFSFSSTPRVLVPVFSLSFVPFVIVVLKRSTLALPNSSFWETLVPPCLMRHPTINCCAPL